MRDKVTLTEKRFFEWHEDEKSVTLRNRGGSYGGGLRGTRYLLYQDVVGSLCATDYKWIQQEQVMQDKLIIKTYQKVTGPLMANSHPGSYCGQDAYNDMFITEGEKLDTIVRRLTPLECERLQGFPDGWTDIGEWTDSKGKLHKESSDSARYKALGNSIALPFWFWLLRRISAQYDGPATLGSLFDGIGGFPLAWVRCNGTDSVLWTSEIEEFPIAVVKRHFGDEESKGDIKEYL